MMMLVSGVNGHAPNGLNKSAHPPIPSAELLKHHYDTHLEKRRKPIDRVYDPGG